MITATGGYYYEGSRSGRKTNRTSTSNNTRHTNIKAARFVFLVAIIAASFLFGALMHAYASDRDSSGTHMSVESYYISHSVQSGQSLWSIAKIYLPANQDIRAFIQDIKAMNGLKSSMLYEGQLLQIPATR